MAVEREQSDFVAALEGRKFSPIGGAGEYPRFIPFRHKQAVAGDANSLVDLARLPPGRVLLFPQFCWLARTAFGNGRTLDIGHTAYTKRNGADVAADEDALVDGLNVSAAGQAAWSAPSGSPWIDYESRAGVTIQAKVLGSTIPVDAELNGFLVFLHYA